jgi:lipopolysaccharide heptosyltransferase II
MAEIPLLLGYSRENPYQLLTNWVPEVDDLDQPDMRHEVRRQLDLVATIGCHPKDERLSLEVPQRAVSRVLQMLADMGLNLNRPWAIMHPGATAPSRRYPPQQFAAAAEQLASDYDIQIVFSGVRTESEIVEEIRTSMQVDSFSVAGALNINEFSALVSLAPLLISNNTGPAHIAAATGTPVVDLYALTNPQHTPWMVPSRVLYHDVSCKYCYKSVCPMGHHDCLRLVPPIAVVQAAVELLNEANLVKRQEVRSLSLT